MRRLIGVILGLLCLWGSLSAQDNTTFTGDIFFLAHDADGIANVHSLMLDEDATPIALTSASIDIYYYDIAPDASFLVVAERGERGGASDIVRLSADGTLATLIACRDVDVDCRRPVIAPDGERIAYERMVMNGGDVPDVPEAPEIWLWQDDETYLIAQGIQPAWDDEGELRYQSLEAMPESTVTPHDSNDDGTQGAYLAQEEGVQRVYVWRDTPDNVQVLHDDTGYTYRRLVPSPDGAWLLLERFNIATRTPEIALYDWQTDTLRFLTQGWDVQWQSS
jgi:hypothetical protein